MERVYLDTSAIVKRYVKENGSELMSDLYGAAEQEGLSLRFSVWNIGEVLGVLDAYQRRNWIKKSEEERAVRLFSAETVKLVKLNVMSVLPVQHSYLAESWKLVRRRHVYQADALQLVTAARNASSVFLSADSVLLRCAKGEGIRAFNVESDENDIRGAVL